MGNGVIHRKWVIGAYGDLRAAAIGRMVASNQLREATMLRVPAVVLASMLLLAPLGARAADLVVWWQNGYYAQEDAVPSVSTCPSM